ncbi:CHAT domain-containing protein [Streptomyces sp. NPDC005279]|uniref:CHAT domain-containing protein n=1 Tax=Streptomyces sp. NPDC005279 TaxID=3364712 RepID=UPI0036BBC9A2
MLAGLRTHDWVHFAGNADQDPGADDNGHLVCHDHATAGPLTTADIVDAQSASRSFLAYLAACDTARGRATTPTRRCTSPAACSPRASPTASRRSGLSRATRPC